MVDVGAGDLGRHRAARACCTSPSTRSCSRSCWSRDRGHRAVRPGRIREPGRWHDQPDPMLPSSLLVDGVGGVFALSCRRVSSAYELAPVFGEEARNRESGVPGDLSGRWRSSAVLRDLRLGHGHRGRTVQRGRRRRRTGSRPRLRRHRAHYGKPLSYLATLLLITSIFGAMLSFHNGVGRYVFGLSREGVLPQVFSRVGTQREPGRRADRWLAAAVAIALIVLVVCIVILQLDPVKRSCSPGWSRPPRSASWC